MKNIGASVQARLKNLSREIGVDMPSLLRRYVQERLLYRVSASGHADRFVLKGGLLLAAYGGGDLSRPTEDIDFNGLGEGGSVEELRAMLVEVLSEPSPADDGVEFDLSSMTVAKDRTGIVPGGKIVMAARVGSARVNLRIDVGFGNPVTPGVKVIEFPSLLSNVAPTPSTGAYPLETVIAEKVHAMAQFGVMNTRVKDYYDILLLSRSHAFEKDLLADAITNTFAHQRRAVDPEMPGLGRGFVEASASAWKKFTAKLRSDVPADLGEAVEEISAFLVPALESARSGVRDGSYWEPGEGWQTPAPSPR